MDKQYKLMKKTIIILSLVLLCCRLSFASDIDLMMVYTPEDKAIFDDYVLHFESRKDLPVNQLMVETGFYFLETPYVSYTLEVAKPLEKLIINLRELDCTTFTETCLALSRTIKSNDVSFERYAKELERIRYRNGILDGYDSRLHYFSDWICDNDKLNIVKDVTFEDGGIPFLVTFNTMTKLSKNYPQLADTTVLKKIAIVESSLNECMYHYIPKGQLDASKVLDGDIIAMTVSGKGLDVMHMGIAVHINNELYFIHASSTGKRVMVTYLPFKEYSAAIKANTGYMIVRPREINK